MKKNIDTSKGDWISEVPVRVPGDPSVPDPDCLIPVPGDHLGRGVTWLGSGVLVTDP